MAEPAARRVLISYSKGNAQVDAVAVLRDGLWVFAQSDTDGGRVATAPGGGSGTRRMR